MTETNTHEGVEYRKVKRKAEVGELVYVISCAESPELDFKIGKCTENNRFNDDSICIGLPTMVYKTYGFLNGHCDEYLVLEPTEPIEETPVEASTTVIELLANISRRLYEAEKEITELNEKQAVFFDIDKLLKNRIFDLERQNRVQAYEINELYREVADRG